MENKSPNRKGWPEIGEKIFGSFLRIMEIRTEDLVRTRAKRMSRRVISFVLLGIGAIYFLNGLTVLLNLFFGSIWVGYILVGFGLFAVSALVPRRNYDD